MGKKKKAKGQAKKNETVTGDLMLTKLVEEMGAEAGKVGLLDKLDSKKSNDRNIGCGAVSHLLFQAENNAVDLCKALAGKGVPKKLLTLTLGADLFVASTAARSLRNFCVVGGEWACQNLMNTGVFAPVFDLLTDGRITDSKPVARFRLLEQALPILGALCANQEAALEQFMQGVHTNPNLMQNIFALTKADCPPAVVVEAVSLLVVVSDDNVAFANGLFGAAPLLQHLMAVLGNTDSLVTARSGAAAVLTNCVGSIGGGASGEIRAVMEAVIKVLSEMLEAATLDPVQAASVMTAELGEEMKRVGNLIDGEEKTEKGEVSSSGQWEIKVEERTFLWRQVVIAVNQALEVTANIATMTASEQEGAPPGELAQMLMGLLNQYGILPKVLSKLGCGSTVPGTSPAVLDIKKTHQILREGLTKVLSTGEVEKCMEMINKVRRTAATCLSNLCLHLPPALLGDLTAPVQSACSLLASLEFAWAQAPVVEPGTPRAAAGPHAFAVAETEALTMLLGNICRHRAELAESQLQLVCAIAQGPAKSLEVQVNAAAILGLLGKGPAHQGHNLPIGAALLGLLQRGMQHESCLEVAAEAINSIIDVYTEDNTHTQQIQQLGVLGKLSAVARPMKQLIQKAGRQRLLDPMAMDRAQEALENASAFVDYKKQHL